MVYGVWCMVYGVWCMVCGVWCMVCGVCDVCDVCDCSRQRAFPSAFCHAVTPALLLLLSFVRSGSPGALSHPPSGRNGDLASRECSIYCLDFQKCDSLSGEMPKNLSRGSSGELLGRIWGASGQSVGRIWGRSGEDLGRISTLSARYEHANSMRIAR